MKIDEMTNRLLYAKFKFIESEDYMLYDDIYELNSNSNIYIQINEYFGYIVHILNDKHTESKEFGKYDSLFNAMVAAASLNKKIRGNK